MYLQVAVKPLHSFSIYGEVPAHLVPELDRVFLTWETLKHRHIQPLLGYTVTEEGVDLVSPWFKNGNIGEFLEQNPHVDRLGLVRAIAVAGMRLTDQFPSDSAGAGGRRAEFPPHADTTYRSRRYQICKQCNLTDPKH